MGYGARQRSILQSDHISEAHETSLPSEVSGGARRNRLSLRAAWLVWLALAALGWLGVSFIIHSL